MTAPVVVAVAFAGALIAFAFVAGTPILAVPIVILLLLAMGGLELLRRKRRARELPQRPGQAPEPAEIEFTERDRRTLHRAPSEEERRRNRAEGAVLGDPRSESPGAEPGSDPSTRG